MKLSICLVLLTGVAFGQNIVSGSVSYTDLSHSAALIHFNADAFYNNLRIRFATAAEGSCTTGNGHFQASPYRDNFDGKFHATDRMQIVLSGLQANTSYTVCPEISNNGGSDGSGTWHGGVSTSFTTLALPAQHPVEPISPETYDPAYPDTTGYHEVTIASDCSNRAALIDDALAHDKTYGTIIWAAPNVTCSDRYEPNTNSEGVILFSNSSVTAGGTASTSLLHIPNTGSEGQGLIFANANYSGLPGVGSSASTVQNSPETCTGIVPGYVYYKHIPASDPDTFQLTCNAPFGQTGVGGASQVMVFSNAGFPGSGGAPSSVDLYPANRYWVILRTSTTDNQFAPTETRVSPAWASKMPKMVNPFVGETIDGTHGAPACNGFGIFSTTRCDGGNPTIISNLWIMGWEITPSAFLDNQTSTDGEKTYNFLGISSPSHRVVLDRMYIHGLGAPYRIFATIGDWTGRDQVIKNSYFDKQDIFQSNYSGLNMVFIDANHFKVAAGKHALNGAHKYTQNSDITVTITGTASGPGWVSASLDGTTLNIALPPGITGSCAGGPCNIFTMRSPGNGAFHPGSHGFPDQVGGSSLYWVNPMFNTTTSTSGVTGILDSVPDPSQGDFSASASFAGGSYEIGTMFVARANGFIPSVRFYKPPQDTATSHTVTLWSFAGVALQSVVTFGETSSGWQTAVFASAPAVSTGQTYTVSYFAPNGIYYADNWFRNQNMVNTNMEAVANYVSTNGNGCDSSNTWPANWAGHARVGVIGCIFVSGGAIVYNQNGDARGSVIVRVNNTNGSNAIQSGGGPGPLMFRNNYFGVTGNGEHFNEAHQDGFDSHFSHWKRGDVSIIRNEYETPIDHISPWTDPNDSQFGANGYTPAYDPGLIAKSNGLYYQGRQPLEFKAGQRHKIDGNRFHGGFSNTAASIFIAMTAVCDQRITDGSITNNSFSHGPGVITISDTEGGCMQTPPLQRFRFSNNLIYDIRGAYWAPGGVLPPGAGWVFNALPHEDISITHNTVFLNRGTTSAFILLYDQKSEGVKIENNAFYTYDRGRSIMVDNSNYASGPFECQQIASAHGLGGKLYADCALTNYTFTNNLLLGDSSKAAIEASDWWPASMGNFVPADPTNPNTVNWFNIASVYQSGWSGLNGPPATPDGTPDFRLKSSSSSVSGAAGHANDGGDIGVDINALDIAQGKVGAPNVANSSITTSAASVVFTAPDAQACSVDYSSSDRTLITSFSRASDPTTNGRQHTVPLSGLSTKTTYYYRVNCAVEQPTGAFRTK
jgi:hypothetical protein